MLRNLSVKTKPSLRKGFQLQIYLRLLNMRQSMPLSEIFSISTQGMQDSSQQKVEAGTKSSQSQKSQRFPIVELQLFKFESLSCYISEDFWSILFHQVYHNHAKSNGFMNCTPKVRQKKSNFRGVFIMKLTYEDKVQIYELRNQGYSLDQLSNKFGINISNLSYMIKLIDRYLSLIHI